MTLASKFFSLFPACHLVSIFGALVWWIDSHSPIGLIIFLGAIYLFPLMCFRILNFFTPIKEGKSDILAKKFSPWWAGHQIQSLFIAVPALEAVLKILPGFYTLWLRCWGSEIGKNVYWTPGSIHYDRNLLLVGDNVVFGEQSLTVCHVITPKEGSAELSVAKVKIGENSFIGAAAVLSPGAVIDKNSFLKAGTRVYPFEHFQAKTRDK